MDKKLSLSLEKEFLDCLAESPGSFSSSPSLSSKDGRKTLIYLVLTLNHMYPDYDFSAVQAHHFVREDALDNFELKFNSYMLEAAREWASINGESSLLESTLRAIDEVINLEECEVYSYYPDFEEDPSLEKGAIWSFYFFFYNKKLKRVVSFRCACLSKLVMDDDQFVDEMQMNDDWDIFDGMDM
ncbi:repressor of RNA polymerase III transcription MAF1 homolog isoform X2 [Amborella trichopoda]|nr:repressor of RNA polymerase III transcription MAF1 homolog isoform X2 [Amborella trichopoda]|eukprot:XP_020518269.1 repressor of RNA polymerase III transcription MAF1 homolog isoform X2 [Amborella trichopoda]